MTMKSSDLLKLVDDLEANREYIPSKERKALVRRAVESVEKDETNQEANNLLLLLARDSKRDVKLEVARNLPNLPESIFNRLVSILLDDNNAYVSRAAEQAMDRRRKSEKEVKRKQTEVSRLNKELNSIKNLHGEMAAGKAEKLARKMYARLLGETVHELRKYLTPLVGETDRLLRLTKDESFSRREFETSLLRTRSQLEQMKIMFEDMQNYSQEPSRSFTRLKLNKIISKEIENVKDLLSSQGGDVEPVSVEFQQDNFIQLDGVENQLSTIFNNLIKNAFESYLTGPNQYREGVVTIDVNVMDNDWILIEVSDQGMGLSEEELEEISRFSTPKTVKPNGTGFGMLNVQKYVSSHGGKLIMDSEEDIGTTISVILPQYQREGGE